MNNSLLTTVFIALLSVYSASGYAGEADIIDVKVQHNGGDSFQVIATVKHADTGWKHYANAFEVLDMEDNILGTRVLYHPHVDEQPFTRSLRVKIPASVKQIKVRAVDSVHGKGGKHLVVGVPH